MTIACVVLLNHSIGIYALVLGTALGLDRADARAAPVISLDRTSIARSSTCTIPGCSEDLDSARSDHRRLGGRAARALLRSFLRIDARAGLYRRHELRDETREFSPANLRRRNRHRDLSAARGTVRAREPARRRPQRRHRSASGELHHDSGRLRFDRPGTSDGAGTLRARNVSGERDRSDGLVASLRGDRADRTRGQRRA